MHVFSFVRCLTLAFELELNDSVVIVKGAGCRNDAGYSIPSAECFPPPEIDNFDVR